MSKNSDDLPAVIGDEWLPDPEAKPKSLAEINEQYGIEAPHQKAEDLVDETFAIMGLRRIASDMGLRGYYYFATCADPKSGEVFTTALGGTVLLDKLDALIQAGVAEPTIVTLRYRERGSDNSYYFFE